MLIHHAEGISTYFLQLAAGWRASGRPLGVELAGWLGSLGLEVNLETRSEILVENDIIDQVKKMFITRAKKC